MTTDGDGPERFVESIRQSGLTIYDAIDIGDPKIWIPTPELQALLDYGLRGTSLASALAHLRIRVIISFVFDVSENKEVSRCKRSISFD